jgi:hypothetical protein
MVNKVNRITDGMLVAGFLVLTLVVLAQGWCHKLRIHWLQEEIPVRYNVA